MEHQKTINYAIAGFDRSGTDMLALQIAHSFATGRRLANIPGESRNRTYRVCVFDDALPSVTANAIFEIYKTFGGGSWKDIAFNAMSREEPLSKLLASNSPMRKFLLQDLKRVDIAVIPSFTVFAEHWKPLKDQIESALWTIAELKTAGVSVVFALPPFDNEKIQPQSTAFVKSCEETLRWSARGKDYLKKAFGDKISTCADKILVLDGFGERYFTLDQINTADWSGNEVDCLLREKQVFESADYLYGTSGIPLWLARETCKTDIIIPPDENAEILARCPKCGGAAYMTLLDLPNTFVVRVTCDCEKNPIDADLWQEAVCQWNHQSGGKSLDLGEMNRKYDELQSAYLIHK
jgi:hypothetical protein